MKKDDMVKELVSRIRYNSEQRDYYAQRVSEGIRVANSYEMKVWYEGRVSAFNIALMMIDPSHPMVEGQIPNNSGAAV